MKCYIPLQSQLNIFSETSTVAQNGKKIGQFTFPQRVLITGLLVSAIGATNSAFTFVKVDQQEKNGTLVPYPMLDVIATQTAVKYFFPDGHGMKIEIGQAVGCYSYSELNGKTFTRLYQIYYHPFA